MDEFHYYADRERGVAWQIPLLDAQARALPPHVGDARRHGALRDDAHRRSPASRPRWCAPPHRPVPLDFSYRETPLHETVRRPRQEGEAAPSTSSTSRSAARAEEAQNLMSVDVSSKEEKKAITEALHGAALRQPLRQGACSDFCSTASASTTRGSCRSTGSRVEKLAQKGLLKVICGTDTLGVGVNIPIRTVLFTKLCKFDGEKTAHPERARLPADQRARGAQGLRRRRGASWRRRPST